MIDEKLCFVSSVSFQAHILYGAYKYHGFRIRVHYLQKNSDDFNFGQIK